MNYFCHIFPTYAGDCHKVSEHLETSTCSAHHVVGLKLENYITDFQISTSTSSIFTYQGHRMSRIVMPWL